MTDLTTGADIQGPGGVVGQTELATHSYDDSTSFHSHKVAYQYEKQPPLLTRNRKVTINAGSGLLIHDLNPEFFTDDKYLDNKYCPTAIEEDEIARGDTRKFVTNSKGTVDAILVYSGFKDEQYSMLYTNRRRALLNFDSHYTLPKLKTKTKKFYSAKEIVDHGRDDSWTC